MTSLTLNIRNYKAIPYRKPLTLEIGAGITFFLGPNNVGKSSLIEVFYELRTAIARVVNGEWKFTLNLPSLADELFNQGSEERELEIIASTDKTGIRIRVSQQGDQSNNAYHVDAERVGIGGDELKRLYGELKALFVDSILIPSLRPVSLRTHDGKLKDTNVGSALISEIGQWQTGQSLSKKKQFDKLEAEIGELFSVQNFRIEVSSASGGLQIRFDDQIFWIDDLGDGLAHFIFALANALFRKPAYVLIDEPEIGLHPRLQQTFVRALAAKATHGLIAASHSIGLARSTADRILTVQKGHNGVTVREFGDNSPYAQHITDSLHELGYAQFVELGGDCILLVEGHTDIKAFREILRKFGAEQKVIIWHLGGSGFLASADAMQELSEVRRLNPRKIAVIFDSERTSAGAPLEPKFEAFKTQAEKLGYLVFPTDWHSTENYISQSALDAVFPTKRYKALAPFEKRDKSIQNWGKSENWKLFREMSREEIENTGLGIFITKTLLS